METGSRVPAASRLGCSVARTQSDHPYRCTGTCSLGRMSLHFDRRHHPVDKHFPCELHRHLSSCAHCRRNRTGELSVCRRGFCPSRAHRAASRTPDNTRSHPKRVGHPGRTAEAPDSCSEPDTARSPVRKEPPVRKCRLQRLFST